MVGETKQEQSEYLQKYFELLEKVGDVEAGSALKGIWPKELGTIEGSKKNKLLDAELISPLEAKVKKGPIKMLDAACGNGAQSIPIAYHLAQMGEVDFIMVDFQQDAIDAAKAQIAKLELPEGLTIQYIVSKLGDYTPEVDSLDGVTIFNALHFIETQEAIKALANISGGMQKDGSLYGSVCSIFNVACIGQNDESMLNEVLEETAEGHIEIPFKSHNRRYGNMYFYTEHSLRDILKQGGLELTGLVEYQNPKYPNGFGEKYPENFQFSAKRHS